MPGHDIIVIGASAGGIKALGAIVGVLPAENLDKEVTLIRGIILNGFATHRTITTAES